MAAPILFKGSDTGANRLSGTAGDLLAVLDQCLIINKLFTAVSGASFVDNTAEARLEGGTTFKLFQGPTVTVDEAYFGLQAKFGRVKLNFGTLGVQGSAVTLAWEYWNGTAWTALSGVTDGTSGLTAHGTVTWTIPGNWVANAVNSVTLLWVRLRFTAGTWTTNPLANYATITGWTQPFTPAGNVCDYKQGGGNGFYLDVNDNGPGSGGAREARIVGCETMSGLGRASGTNLFPTASQSANGLFVRKSTTLDTTNRTWVLIADDRTFYFFNISGDTLTPASSYFAWGFGDLFSLVSGDGYRTMILGRNVENITTATPEIAAVTQSAFNTASGTVPAQVVARPYTGVVGAVTILKVGGLTSFLAVQTTATQYTVSNLANPNPADGGYYVGPFWIEDGNSGSVRGRFRGWWHLGSFSGDGNTFSGVGSLNGKTFHIIHPIANGGNLNCAFVLETSDTWETSS